MNVWRLRVRMELAVRTFLDRLSAFVQINMRALIARVVQLTARFMAGAMQRYRRKE
jgi:hypothetical protein